jgi:DNA replication protein DnaC
MRQRRVERLLRASKLPPGKTFDVLQDKRLPRPLWHKLTELSSGAFLERATNVLAFGLPGTGNSHCDCPIGHALIEKGLHDMSPTRRCSLVLGSTDSRKTLLFRCGPLLKARRLHPCRAAWSSLRAQHLEGIVSILYP